MKLRNLISLSHTHLTVQFVTFLVPSRAMIKGLLSLLFLLITYSLSAHVFFFAFAEMEYNAKDQRFEITMRATGHDVEDYMKHLQRPIGKLEDCVNNPLKLKVIEEVLLNEFQLKTEDKSLALELIGLEVNLKDEVTFYIVSKKMELPSTIEITFNFLMDYFEEQQNKITIITPTGKEYLTFLRHKPTRKFEFIKL